MTTTITECPKHWAYHNANIACPACRAGGNRYTAFCSFGDTPRGQYDEEIDVLLPRRSATAARKIADAAIVKEYASGLQVRRVVRNF